MKDFLKENWQTIVVSAVTTIVYRLLLSPGDHPQRGAVLQSAIRLPEQLRCGVPAPTAERRQLYLYLSGSEQRSGDPGHHADLLLQKSADAVSAAEPDGAEYLERCQH